MSSTYGPCGDDSSSDGSCTPVPSLQSNETIIVNAVESILYKLPLICYDDRIVDSACNPQHLLCHDNISVESAFNPPPLFCSDDSSIESDAYDGSTHQWPQQLPI
jgi:hypothetical protein